MKHTRRDILLAGAGVAVALPLTPVPYKVLDDVSIWTQNWSWIPRPPRGPLGVRFTACTLCDAACPVRARMVGEHAVGLAGLGGNGLCPLGVSAHQLPHHPYRLRTPLRHGAAAELKTIASEVAALMKAGPVAVLDERPGRAGSLTRLDATYTAVRPVEARTLDAIAAQEGHAAESLGLDFEHVDAACCVRVALRQEPRLLRMWAEGRLRMVGSLVEASPVRRAPAPYPERPALPFSAIADGSLSVLIVDHGPLGGAVPWQAIERKLRPGGAVVSLTPYLAGAAKHARYAIPTPAWPESADEAGTPWHATAAQWTVAPALIAQPAGCITPAEFLALFGSPAEPALEQRCAAIHKAARGSVLAFASGEEKPVRDFESAAKLQEAMTAGARWTDEAKITPVKLPSARGEHTRTPLPRPAVLPVLMAKLDRESGLRRS